MPLQKFKKFAGKSSLIIAANNASTPQEDFGNIILLIIDQLVAKLSEVGFPQFDKCRETLKFNIESIRGNSNEKFFKNLDKFLNDFETCSLETRKFKDWWVESELQEVNNLKASLKQERETNLDLKKQMWDLNQHLKDVKGEIEEARLQIKKHESEVPIPIKPDLTSDLPPFVQMMANNSMVWMRKYADLQEASDRIIVRLKQDKKELRKVVADHKSNLSLVADQYRSASLAYNRILNLYKEEPWKRPDGERYKKFVEIVGNRTHQIGQELDLVRLKCIQETVEGKTLKDYARIEKHNERLMELNHEKLEEVETLMTEVRRTRSLLCRLVQDCDYCHMKIFKRSREEGIKQRDTLPAECVQGKGFYVSHYEGFNWEEAEK